MAVSMHLCTCDSPSARVVDNKRHMTHILCDYVHRTAHQSLRNFRFVSRTQFPQHKPFSSFNLTKKTKIEYMFTVWELTLAHAYTLE